MNYVDDTARALLPFVDKYCTASRQNTTNDEPSDVKRLCERRVVSSQPRNMARLSAKMIMPVGQVGLYILPKQRIYRYIKQIILPKRRGNIKTPTKAIAILVRKKERS